MAEYIVPKQTDDDEGSEKSNFLFLFSMQVFKELCVFNWYVTKKKKGLVSCILIMSIGGVWYVVLQ